LLLSLSLAGLVRNFATAKRHPFKFLARSYQWALKVRLLMDFPFLPYGKLRNEWHSNRATSLLHGSKALPSSFSSSLIQRLSRETFRSFFGKFDILNGFSLLFPSSSSNSSSLSKVIKVNCK